MASTKGFKEIQSLMKIAEVAPHQVVTNDVVLVNTTDVIKELNDKKIAKETAKVEPKIDVTEVIQQAIKSAIDAQEVKLQAALAAKEAELQESIKAKEEQLQAERTQYQEALEEVKQSSAEQLAKMAESLKATNNKLDNAQKNEKNISELFKLHGKTHPVKEAKTPYLNTVTTTDSDRIAGSLADYNSIKERSNLILKRTAKGNPYYTRDFREADSFVTNNRQSVIKDLESWGRKNGLLQGGSYQGQVVKEAATVVTDIPGGFLDTLSSIIRTTHRPGYVFWQFAQTEFNYLAGEGTNVLVQRSAYLPSSTDPADWELSGGGSFAAIDTTLQGLTTGTVPITLKEYGLGKIGTSNQPVSLPSFVLAYSMIDLMAILERNLGQNYAEFEERKIRSLYNATSALLYSNQGNVVTTPGALTASGTYASGTMTKEFLIALYAYMSGLKVETFADGCFAIVLNTVSKAQLINSLQTLFRVLTIEDLQLLSAILNPTVIPPENGSRISGYVGNYYGFHVFVSNGFSTGGVGSEGVQNETILGTATLTRTSYAFGNSAVGRGVGTPMEIRQNEITNYQRINSYIWRSEEGFAALDVDPTGYSDTSTVPQQLRVFQVRTTGANL